MAVKTNIAAALCCQKCWRCWLARDFNPPNFLHYLLY